jgi:hypothetical protein
MQDTTPITTAELAELKAMLPDGPMYNEMCLSTSAFLPVGNITDYAPYALNQVDAAIMNHYGILGYFGRDPLGHPVFIAQTPVGDDDALMALQFRLDRLLVEGHTRAYVQEVTSLMRLR